MWQSRSLLYLTIINWCYFNHHIMHTKKQIYTRTNTQIVERLCQQLPSWVFHSRTEWMEKIKCKSFDIKIQCKIFTLILSYAGLILWYNYTIHYLYKSKWRNINKIWTIYQDFFTKNLQCHLWNNHTHIMWELYRTVLYILDSSHFSKVHIRRFF